MDPLSAIGICTLTLGTLAAALYVARREACHHRALPPTMTTRCHPAVGGKARPTPERKARVGRGSSKP
jgi:hypothetical protein